METPPAPPNRGFGLPFWDLVALGLAGFLAGNSTLVALVANLAELSETARWWVQVGLLAVTVLVALLLAPQLGRSLLANWRNRALSVDLLFVLGCLGATGFSLTSMIRGQGPVYFEVVSLLLVIYCLGSWVKGSAQRRVWQGLDAWSPEQHRCQVVLPDGRLAMRLVQEVESGDRVQVPAGEMIPVDGVIVQGQAFVRESSITGEPHVRAVHPGDAVFASSIAVDAVLHVEASRAGNNRIIDGVTAALRAAQRSPSRWESQAEQVAKWFTPTVAAVALMTAAVWWLQASPGQAWLVALAVLLVACPCAFGFATPVSIWVTLSRLANRGLVVQRNDVIERLAEVDTVLFDKTGTLTVVQPSLVEFRAVDGGGWSTEELRTLAASLESASRHPLATAFLADVPGSLYPVRNWEALPAVGVRGSLQTPQGLVEITLGRATGSTLPLPDGPFWDGWLNEAAAAGEQVIWIWIEDQPVAAARIGEVPLDTLDEGLDRLEQMGLACALISGDRGQRVQRLGLQISGEGVQPDDKAGEVKRLEDAGRKVLFVGDGTNDASAMAVATASIAVATGSSLTVEAADLVWHGHNLNSIGEAIQIARRSVQRLRRSIRFAITYNSLGMLIAAVGWLHPAVAVILMMGSSLTVVLYAADWQGELAEDPVPVQRQQPPPPPTAGLVQLQRLAN